MLVEDSIRLIRLKTDHQHDAKEEKEKKIQGFSKKKVLVRGLVHQTVGN
jgi:hypothetical protein